MTVTPYRVRTYQLRSTLICVYECEYVNVHDSHISVPRYKSGQIDNLLNDFAIIYLTI